MNPEIRPNEDNTNQPADQTAAKDEENQESIEDENNSVQKEISNEKNKRKVNEMSSGDSSESEETPKKKKKPNNNIEDEKKRVCKKLKEENDRLVKNPDIDSHYSRPWHLHRPSKANNLSTEYWHAFNLNKGFYLSPGITFILSRSYSKSIPNLVSYLTSNYLFLI